MRPVPAHYIRENKMAFVPRRLVVLDSESQSVMAHGGEKQFWRCGAAFFGHWTNRGTLHNHLSTFTEPRALWTAIGEHTRPRQRTVVYAHNLPYDMRITEALVHLPSLGFRLDAIRVASQGCWSRWNRDSASLTLVDSASLFPVTLYRLGQFLETRKLPLPEGDNIDEWLARCVRDVEILAATMVQYFEWLRSGVAGNWQLTGAGQSWAHWRHAHYTHPVLVHADREAIDAERRAMWTGRAEALQWGRNYTEPVYEWDWENSYPRIALTHNVPTKLRSTTRALAPSELRMLAQRHIVLADVEVETDTPVVPARHSGRILWPVGTFDTTLWWPEIASLLAAGATVHVRRAWLYQGEPALRQWASWVLHELHDQTVPRHRWQAILLKHWSRTLIGRFATQYQNWELFGWNDNSAITMGRMHDVDTGADQSMMQIGNEVHVMTGLTESDDSCPQITSYIMSAARALLWDAMSAVGSNHLLYVDTDSLVVDTIGNAILRRLTQQGHFPGLRLKSRQLGYEIYGPRSAIIGDAQKFAGIPRHAVRMDDTTWRGEVWTQFERSLQNGEHNSVTITKRRFTTRWNEHRRARLANGYTTPYRLPGYQPNEHPGELPPVTEAEKAQYIRTKLGARITRNGGNS